MKNKAFYGVFGGQYVPEILMPALKQLESVFEDSIVDEDFMQRFNDLLCHFAGRPTPISYCENLSKEYGAQIYLKREDLLHGGAHKTNQVIGQALLAIKMGKKEIIAETGAGQHGVATASICALLNLKCRVYMGKKDIERQSLNVFRMKLMGAEVIEVTHGSASLKDACSEALRDWSRNYDTAHYLLGTAAGPHPFPLIVKTFQSMIGRESIAQMKEVYHKDVDYAIACVGGGSNAIGLFADFIDTPTKLIGVEPAGKGLDTNFHGSPIYKKEHGIFFGMKSYLMQDDDGQIQESYSISAGLDFPSVGPEHAYLDSIGRASYVSIDDEKALEAFQLLSAKEGIIPALESAHAVAYALELSKDCHEDDVILVNLSGRGDKDIHTVYHYLNKDF